MTKDEFIATYEKSYKLTVEWTTGGMSGGNCWGDSPSSSVEPDEEPEHELLDEILMELAPTTTYMEYRRIVKADQLIIRRSWEDYEYYGNYYAKASKQLNLEVLWPYIEILMNIPDPAVRVSHYALIKD